MYKNAPIALSLLFSFAVSNCAAAYAHSGGTDAGGCHENRKTGDYHCHTPKSGRSSASLRSSRSSVSSRPSVTSLPSNSTELVTGVTVTSPLAAPTPPFDMKSASGLSEKDYASDPNCKRFTFSEVVRQSDNGFVRLHCGQVVMSIDIH